MAFHIEMSLAASTRDYSQLSKRNLSNLTYVGYVNDPDGRGTASLVLSCLVTLVLCVWSALHLNVPSKPRRRQLFGSLWLNLRWIVAGIYAPELVVFVAWRQWSSAQLLQRHIEDLADMSENAHGRVRNLNWTISHSFFACAGGFAVELESLTSSLTPRPEFTEKNRPQRVTLSAKGVLMLAKFGELPNTTRDEIEDKSKANDLAKATVIIQATWMLIQIVGRLIAKLPITLLEVNTGAHVLCAFAMYIFWWHKPLLPNEPIVIRDERLAPLIALMYSSSEMSGYIEPEFIKSQTVIKTIFANILQYSTTPEIESLCLRDSHGVGTPLLNDLCSNMYSTCKSLPRLPNNQILGDQENDGHYNCYSSLFIQRLGSSCLPYLESISEKEREAAFFERRPRIVREPGNAQDVSKAEVTRWNLIKKAFAHNPELLSSRTLLSHQLPGSSDKCIHLKAEQFVVTHVPNWPSNDLIRSIDGLVVGMVLWLANLCYGGLHAAAWADHFPSTVEKWLWRTSSVYIAFCGGLWVILNLLVSKYPKLNAFWEKWADGQKSLTESIGLGMLVLVCGFSLFAARVFIVVEAFVSIRRLPEAAYQTPQWTTLFPHF